MKSTFDGSTKLKTVLDTTSEALEYIVSLNPHDFTRLRNSFMRKYMASRITLRRVAAMAGISENKFINHLNQLAKNDAPILDESQVPPPPPQTSKARPGWLNSDSPVRVIDVLAIDDASGDPMPPIMTGTRRLQPGQMALLKHRWEPQPLYDIWDKTGLEWFAEHVAPMEWHIYIFRPRHVAPWKERDTVLMMLDHLNPDEIAPRCKAFFDQLAVNESIVIRARSKVLLEKAKDELGDKNTFTIDEVPAENGKIGIRIWRCR